MPVEVSEITKFARGIVSSASETDINSDFATFSLNVDSDVERGALRGIKGNYILGAGGWEIPRYAKWLIKINATELHQLVGSASNEYTVTGASYNNSISITHSADLDVHVGDLVTGTNIPANAYVTQVASSTKFLINEVTTGGNTSGQTLNFRPMCKWWILNGFDESFAIGFRDGSNRYQHQADLDKITELNLNKVEVNLAGITSTGDTFRNEVADKIKESLEGSSFQTNQYLTDVTGETKYFTANIPASSSTTHGQISIKSNFYGDIKNPDYASSFRAHTYCEAAGSRSYIYFNDSDLYPSNWQKFIKGTGFTSSSTETLTGQYNFTFLKPMNILGESHIFGVTKEAKAILIRSVGSEDSSIEVLSSSVIESKDITAEQRNKNLYIGMGGNTGSYGYWLGNIKRKQLDKTLEGNYFVKNKLPGLGSEFGALKFDNIVVHNLHYGLNSTNGGIAGAANIYGDTSGADTGYTISNSDGHRTINNWAKTCLTNAGVTVSDQTAFKVGMIFRLDYESNKIVKLYSNDHISNTGGAAEATEFTRVYDYLKSVKEFAKGKFTGDGYYGETDNTDNTGNDAENLHSGDLFQITYVPSSWSESAAANSNGTIKFAYAGVLIGDYKDDNNGDNNTVAKHDSEECYLGMAPHSWAHFNDDKFLYRIRTTSKSDLHLTENIATMYDSEGTLLSSSGKRTEFIDLAEELGVPDFKISTIAEAKSMDGAGGYGGDTGLIANRAKNYYTGYGKLWIANRDEHDKLYLVDFTNWDKIDSSSPRLSYFTVNLDFSRIHPHLLNTIDDTYPGGVSEYGKGLLNLHTNNGQRTHDWNNFFVNYAPTWTPNPEGQFISSICETYSHQAHLGDGAADGNGTGKWRVWVEYSKDEQVPHSRWDLFLFNFRPQPWEQFTGSVDSQTGLGPNNNTAYMFDKTPPYQECTYANFNEEEGGDSRHRIYYPYLKFYVNADTMSSSRGSKLNGGSSAKGWNGIGWTTDGGIQQHKGNHGTGANHLNFRNPSGEYQQWKHIYAGSYDWDNTPAYFLDTGTDIGWTDENPRQWSSYRHCLKPYHKQWYFTGHANKNKAIEFPSPSASVDSYNPTAHIVSTFGTLTGSFVKEGGTFRNRVTSDGWGSDDACWYGYRDGTLEEYNEDISMFTMHDSPVAFASINTGGANKEALFTGSEVQGAPSTYSAEADTQNNVDDAGTYPNANYYATENGTASASGAYLNDTEAGFKGHLKTNGNYNLTTVPATEGFSKFNQFRYHHNHNGTYQLYDDTPDNSNINRPGWGHHDKGGGYYGQDSFGHYNMITTTWANNREHIRYNRNQEIYGDSPEGHYRVFNGGWDEYELIERNNNSHGSINGQLHWYTDANNTSDNMKKTRFGTGYATYAAGDKAEAPNQGGNDPDYYHTGEYADIGGTESVFSDWNSIATIGSKFDNRRTVMCWGTTCLTDATMHKDVIKYDTIRGKANEGKVYKSPRCVFRKLSFPEGVDFHSITAVDKIDWQEGSPDSSTGQIINGFLVQGPLSQSPDSDQDSLGTGFVVYNPKAAEREVIKEGYGKSVSGNNWHRNVSKGYANFSTSEMSPLKKQAYIYSTTFKDVGVCYSNDYLYAKNLIPTLSDRPTSGYHGGATWAERKWDKVSWYTGDDVTQDSEFSTLWDFYTPILVGNGQFSTKDMIATWYRGNMKENPSTNDNMGSFPYYRFDKLFNFWALDSEAMNLSSSNSSPVGFDNCIQTLVSDKRPTETFGSTAGSSWKESTHWDGQYPDTIPVSSVSSGNHIKTERQEFLEKVSEEVTSDNNYVRFTAGSTVWYKFSYLYDGFQESTLNDMAYPFDIIDNCKFLRLKLALPTASKLNINPRVTHINVYRKNQVDELYRLVKSINLDLKESKFERIEEDFIHQFNDDGVSASFEALNGISESLSDLTPNYRLSCQLNDFLFIGGVSHPQIEEGEHFLLRSKQGKFSVFDWSNDFLDLPTKPVAITAFAGRVYVFDENNIHVINPEGMYIEDSVEGVGVLNSDSLIVTDVGMFFADRNNIWVHDGQSANAIGDPILRSQTKPEWQIGYLDAINKAEELGFTPKLTYDPITKCIYVLLQGYSESFDNYEEQKSRLYSFNIPAKRWDYYESPVTKSVVVNSKGNVIMTDGYQIYNYRRDKRNRKDFSWESKHMVMGSSNVDKVFKRLNISGELCLQRFNNAKQLATTDGRADDFGNDEWDVSDNTDWQYAEDGHVLEVSPASEQDDLKVYIDGELKTLEIQNRKPYIGHPLANDSTKKIYKVNVHLPAFNTSNNGLTDIDDTTGIVDSFSINPDSMPEFLSWPNSQFKETTKQGGLEELIHLHKGMYLYFEGTRANGRKAEEIVRVKDIVYKWEKNENGINEILPFSSYPVMVQCWRGLLGTVAQDWYQIATEATDVDPAFSNGDNIMPIRICNPTLKLPSGSKGRDIKIVFQNQKSFIDSFSISYRKKGRK